MLNKYKIVWGGYKNTTIPKMHEDDENGSEAYLPEDLPKIEITHIENSAASANISGVEPLTIHFSNTSTGEGLTYMWDFGDGSTSTAEIPIHIYTTVGTYNITLTATDNIGRTNKSIVEGGVTVTPIPPPPKVTLFEEVNYGGSSVELTVGTHKLNEIQGGTFDNNVKSLEVPEGYTATMWQHPYTTSGWSKVYIGKPGGYSDIGSARYDVTMVVIEG